MTKAILLNDTRFDNHIGCALVVGTITRELRARGVEVARSFTTIPELSGAAGTPDYRAAGLVVLNGEGSMHHDAERNLAMLELCAQARRDGKRAVLINSVWQANVRSNDYLGAFDAVYLRDRRSLDEVRPHRADADWVPDLTLASGFFDGRFWHRLAGRWGGPRYPVLVFDGVVRAAHHRLADLAVEAGWPFVPLGEHGKSLLKGEPDRLARLRDRGLYLEPGDAELRRLLERCGAVVTGRFHAVCLALLAGKPFLAVPSNTHKVESLIEEVGLDRSVVVPVEELTHAVVAERLRWAVGYFGQPDTRRRVRDYLDQARDRTRRMFDRVCTPGRVTLP